MEIRNENKFDVLINIIKHEEIKIMAEIGVWKSQLVENILRSYKDNIVQYWTIDIWEPSESHEKYERTTNERWNYLYLKVCKLMVSFPQLHVIKTSSLNASKLFPPNYFDLVFIDADHHYDAVLSDIEAWFPLIRNNGFLMGDDYGGHHRGVTGAVRKYFGTNIPKGLKGIWIERIVK